MFGATDAVKNIYKSKYAYGDYGIAFDGAGSWSSGNDLVGNVIILGVNHGSSSHTDNCKNNFSVLGEGSTDDINGNVGAAEQKSSINFIKGKTKICFSLPYNGDNSYFFVNRKKI